MRKLALLFLLFAPSAFAQCTGSGTVWSCPAGTTSAQIGTLISSASNNAVATFASGSYTWNAEKDFSASKGITLICGTPGTCNVNTNGTIGGFTGATGTLPNLYRVSGFNFNITDTLGLFALFWLQPATGGRMTVSQFRFDHNTITANTNGNVTILFLGENTSHAYIYGVADHNTITGSGPHPVALALWIGGSDTTPPFTSTYGTGNGFFLEDNTLTMTTNTDTSSPCMTDAWGFATFVVRHNTITNCLEVVHDLTHGGGPQNVEVYNNQFIQTSGIAGQGADNGYRMFHHQGGQEETFWNNTFKPLTSPHDNNTISVTANYVDGACSVYPCLNVSGGHGAQPGYDFGGNQKPIYVWGNTDVNNGTLVKGGNESGGTFVAENRDLYNAQATGFQSSPTTPFNGTVGVGVGSLANRPTTCTTGVGYVVEAVVGTQGASVGAGTASDAQLYRCTSTNTWTLWYTPYTYPHPLVGGATPTASTPSISPAAGSYPGNVAVSIVAANGPVICYTTDGTTPVTNGAAGCTTGTLYTVPVILSANATLKAVAGGTGFIDSIVASSAFTILNTNSVSGGGIISGSGSIGHP